MISEGLPMQVPKSHEAVVTPGSRAPVHARETFSLLSSEHTNSTRIIHLTGGITKFRNDTGRELSFRQESNFFYLTGCHVPSPARTSSSPTRAPQRRPPSRCMHPLPSLHPRP